MNLLKVVISPFSNPAWFVLNTSKYPTMKNCIKLFLFCCLLLAVFTLSATDKPIHHYYHLVDTVTREPFVPFIDLLQHGENYQIEIISLGCFSGSKQTLTIFREANSYTVNFEETIKELSVNDISTIRDFELQLQSLAIGGCSTVDTYTLVYGGNSIQVSDGTCSFNGGRKLMQQLGFIPGK